MRTMGLLNLFSKKKETNSAKPNDVRNEREAKQSGFVLGVRYVFPVNDSENVFVYGRVIGTVTVGDAVYITNFGDDDADITLSVVIAIKQDNGEMAQTASHCNINILLENVRKLPIKCGTVLFTRNATATSVNDGYLDALTNVYVPHSDLVYKPEDADKLSLTDCQEIFSFYIAHKKERQNQDAERIRLNQKAEVNFVNLLVNKLLSAKSIYCVYNKRTNEPHLFTQIIRQEDGTSFLTEPNIMLITKAFHDFLSRKLPTEFFDVREINNENNKEIESFLGTTFYLNGACGAAVNLGRVVINAERIVARPDFSNIPMINRPVMNPDLMRWILLSGQMHSVETESEKNLFAFYSDMIGRELPKANLLVPMKYDGEFISEDETGKGIFKKGGKMIFSIINGKYDRQAIKMYTDWKRFKEAMGDDWSGLIQKAGDMINLFDCVINLGENENTGIYLTKETFDEMITQRKND